MGTFLKAFIMGALVMGLTFVTVILRQNLMPYASPTLDAGTFIVGGALAVLTTAGYCLFTYMEE